MTDLPALRAIFFDEDHARTVVTRLRRDGFTAALASEKYAGEDDDLDHAWAVTSDAPEFVLEMYVDEYDGWLDDGDDDSDDGGNRNVRLNQIPLPDRPIRYKNDPNAQ